MILIFYHFEFCNLFLFAIIKCYLIDLKNQNLEKS